MTQGTAARAGGLLLLVGLLGSLGGCKPAASGRPVAVVSDAAVGAVPSLPAVKFGDSEPVVLFLRAFDTLVGARQGLEEALRLPVDLPLPFPRVEKHGESFRVVLGRGPFATLRALHQSLLAAGQAVQLLAIGQGGNDDVIRLGIVCTDAETVPLFDQALGVTPREIARLKPGQVVVPRADEEEPSHGGHEGDEGGGSEVAERGFVTVLQPQQGLVRGPDVLMPADCTPRDEDNDDGNGRILGAGPGPGDFAKLCLTTRFSGKVAHLSHADVLAVSPNYRRCLRFPGAGTFDGFDHSRSGSHFAVEVDESKRKSPSPTAGVAAPAAGLVGVRLYAVPARGALEARGQFPGSSRPAFLGDNLVLINEEAASLSILVVDGVGRRRPADSTPLPAPRRIASLAVGELPAIPDKVAVHRPAAPMLSNGRVRVAFLRSCRPEAVKRVRAAAGSSYVYCTLELEAEVGLDGQGLERRCRLDNAESQLEEPISIPCP